MYGLAGYSYTPLIKAGKPQEAGVWVMKSASQKAAKLQAGDLLKGKATLTNGTAASKGSDNPDSILEDLGTEPSPCQDGMCPVTWKPRRHAA